MNTFLKTFFAFALSLMISSFALSNEMVFADTNDPGGSTTTPAPAPAPRTNTSTPPATQPSTSPLPTGRSPFYSGEIFKSNESNRYTLSGVVNTLLPGAAKWIAGFLAALAVIFLIYAGVLFLTAGGEEEKISEAMKTAFYVLAGLLLAMFAYVLVYLFLTLFNPS